ncbi:MAG: hypothetical protein A3C93_03000 [Candidatus Lloydbacteria bacterium RIFCSPHIGHO2_02_FULL_54_17]|uniref:Uncharacterized protein n=1 Tax=Candidatus Lloydbacteria bacterium RIFCSPHIGHO2_02_FULL_54_17 TaxID=1798664 RepID=A0A1G2DAJ3_9BACT|nr:MAG: hypothetical protein A2762_04870 [Candidatus Lloydbacteria bacterium RIFCSPHIGHO2_01_FULL_54_11]OGZ10636.1 MAG: hypothetical protein A3C93_03000 [Candidatus Lloydbacteria bacterium RIFCSPHIGHO2_02_FULL_54_17]OGZ13671.1 MAG: hypothetical protein A2948_03190 [Candidatus Lloydbacteria bacterium RIFCSPLOWO2_01_FULL_54_18]OGZ16106.1 MAG: hypothetical protein A3H76_01645 [Candidatus Lloydbacteria bacterium RIFCSPLOWO2_02_FULL_54_12]
MSYEGRQQVWCENGHYDVFDAVDHVRDCMVCNALPALVNQVDDTNGSAEGYIEPVETVPAVYCECFSCGHRHEIVPAKYEIPKKA